MEEAFATVRVQQGVLRGRRVASKVGGTFFSFQGIPYAKPPVGPLRFKVAEEPHSWEGVRDAVQEGPQCPQIDWILNQPYRGDEDCLYLNVYTSQLPTPSNKVRHPVMVWIHGGGFVVGNGSTETYGPDYLVNENVVLVTINYRLGIFGFLSLESEIQPGNIGLKDQVAALRWIQKNIECFGGDSNNVTIFGESAGGASVHFHLLSPLSKGLFHKAIMESGCALCGWVVASNLRELAFALGKILGCSSNDEKELLQFLQNVPARDLIEAHHNFNQRAQAEGRRQLHFGPVIEEFVQHEVFLDSHPQKLMQAGDFNSVPCIIGTNSQEGIFFIALFGILKNPTVLRNFNDNFDSQLPLESQSTRKKIAEKVKNFYFGSKPLTEDSLEEYVDFASDYWFQIAADQCVKSLASSSSPVYYYHFNFNGKSNIFKCFYKASNFSGASHMDELGYLFTTTAYGTPDIEYGSPEWITLRRMVKLWTNFAKTGNPTPTTDSLVNVHWIPYSSSNPSYLSIGNELKIEKNLNEKRIHFWNSLNL